MFPIAVLKYGNDDTTELTTIRLSEVLYVSVDRSKLVFHTQEGTFYQLTTIQEYEKHLKTRHFEKLDRPYLVNMKHVKSLDKERRVVFFTKHPDSTSKFVTVAQLKVDMLESYLQEE